ncbi:hypothetical protein HPB51_008017 [Rhipicephalus microplus]|uniref:Uncharacterized protein n=1 Tax=Rhipicephalus microplus TaxID=6941 RepID=A0A9J6EFV4_RHIMP|nr:hypothetical protein HPB51_008017 [Rhipicephalus microplus]
MEHQSTSLPLKEDPLSGHQDQTGAPVLEREYSRCDEETQQCNNTPSCVTDHGFETLEISEGSSFEGGCSFQDQTSDDDQNGTDAGSLSRVTEPLLVKGVPTFLSCLPNIGGQKPVQRPSTGYLRSLSMQPATALANTNSDVRHWKPQSERESDDDEENVNEEESSSDDEDMPAHWRRIAVSINSKLTFKGQARRPGNQANLARNRQLRL